MGCTRQRGNRETTKRRLNETGTQVSHEIKNGKEEAQEAENINVPNTERKKK